MVDFALPVQGLTLQARLTRGKLALLNKDGDDGVVVHYVGTDVVVVKARDDDGNDATDNTHVRRRFQLANPGAVLQVRIDLRPGAARVQISAGAQSFDTGDIALPAVQQGERYRIRLAAVKLKGQALSGLVDDVVLTTTRGGAPATATTHFVYEAQGRLIGEYTGQGTPVREYVWLSDLPLAVTGTDGVFDVYTDQLNTPRVITNQAQQVMWRWDNNDPFGANAPDQNPNGLGTFTFNPRFPGQYFDRETFTHYNYFRDYDPAIGRYVEPDPIGLDGGINLYGYVGQTPISRVDRFGLQNDVFVDRPRGLFPGFPDISAEAQRNLAKQLTRIVNNLFCPRDEDDRKSQCDYQYYKVDIPTCRGVSRTRGPATGARCYQSAADRYAACLRGEPVPPLDTYNN